VTSSISRAGLFESSADRVDERGEVVTSICVEHGERVKHVSG